MYRQNAVITDVAAARGFIDIKRTAMMFDHVVVLKTQESNFDWALKEHSLCGVEPGEVDWLTENGIVSFVPDFSNELFNSNEPNLKRYISYRKACLGIVALLNQKTQKQKYEDYIRAAANFVTRYSAVRMQQITEDERTIPLLYEPKYELGRLGAQFEFPYGDEPKTSYAQTTATVLSELPIPDESTPWQDILAFREENKNRLAFFALREWIKDATKADLSQAELKDKLELELARLNDSLRLAKIKYRYQTFVTLVTAGVEVLENLLKIKWSEATKTVLSIGQTYVEHLEAEAKIAENGLYYIVKATDAFGGDR